MPTQNPTTENNASVSPDVDFSLRCLIEDMHRNGADERAIVRAVDAALGPKAQQPRRRGALRRDVRNLAQRLSRKA